MTHKILRLILVCIIALSACRPSPQEEYIIPDKFVTVKNGQFYQNGEKVNFIGTNFWYGAILGSEGRGGNRERLIKELDTLNALGMNNLRILVGSDGPEGVKYKVEPVLQLEPGVYNDTIFQGLDFLLAEMAKRQMSAVLYVNNSWEWSGGYGQYLEWAGDGVALKPAESGYEAYVEHVSHFPTNKKAKQIYYDHIETIVSRVNTVTGVAYKDDPTIFSWQIANEPRPFSTKLRTKVDFLEWVLESAKIIKSIDKNHMVSSGSEGVYGCAQEMYLFDRIHSSPDIDYLNIHLWPLAWRWVNPTTYADSLQVAIAKSEEYITMHYPIAEKLNKPIVLEEFGYQRDGREEYEVPFVSFWNGVSLSKDSTTNARDTYYKYLFDRLLLSIENGEPLAGLNFWGWGGYAEQPTDSTFWSPGADYSADPAQEPQGLFSVYVTDSTTTALIKSYTSIL